MVEGWKLRALAVVVLWGVVAAGASRAFRLWRARGSPSVHTLVRHPPSCVALLAGLSLGALALWAIGSPVVMMPPVVAAWCVAVWRFGAGEGSP